MIGHGLMLQHGVRNAVTYGGGLLVMVARRSGLISILKVGMATIEMSRAVVSRSSVAV